MAESREEINNKSREYCARCGHHHKYHGWYRWVCGWFGCRCKRFQEFKEADRG